MAKMTKKFIPGQKSVDVVNYNHFSLIKDHHVSLASVRTAASRMWPKVKVALFDVIFDVYKKQGVLGPEALVLLSQLQAESNFNLNAVSSAGAQGLAQAMPRTWSATMKGTKYKDPFDAEGSVTFQVKYVRVLMTLLRDDYISERVIQAYNTGPTNVRRKRIPAETVRYARSIASKAQRLYQLT
jgi:membrane-bound lytic murein transglycosylase MltF